MSDRPLLDYLETRSRRTDPDTSREAARVARPRAKTDAAKILAFLETRTRAPMTSAELARDLAMDRYVTARRLPDLEKLGLVVRCAARRCTTNHRPAITWCAAKSNRGAQ